MTVLRQRNVWWHKHGAILILCYITVIWATKLPHVAREYMLSVLIKSNSLFLKLPYGSDLFHYTKCANYSRFCGLWVFFFSSPRKKKDMSQHTKAWVYSIAAESYIIFWVYGFLISRYSSQDDVTDMDSEHISNRFLEDIQYGCQETFDPIIKIDNLIYLELYHEISKVLLGVIRRGMASINDYLKEERNRNKVLQLFSGLLPQLPFCIPSWVEYWVYSSKDGKFHRIQMWCELHYRTDITA